MFEPGLTKGMLEVFVAPSHHLHCSADDQSTKAIDIQNAYLNGMPHLPGGKELGFFFHGASSPNPKAAFAKRYLLHPRKVLCRLLMGPPQA